MAKKNAKSEDEVLLVWMKKDGERLEVHPTTVKAHQEAGWKVMEPQPAKEAESPAAEGGEEEPAPEKAE